MKKLLGIVVLGLMWCNTGIAGEMNLWKKKVNLPEDISKGYNKGWKFGSNFDPETHLTPDYAFAIVNKSDGHPVRLGKQSIRFELRRGDCGVFDSGYDDCTIWDESTGHYSERHELNSENKFPSKGVTWHTYSIFLTKDFPIEGHGYEHISLGQFHGFPNNSPGFKWDVDEETYQLRRRTGCHTKEFLKKYGGKDGFKCSLSMPENNTQDVISKKDLRGKWHDIVINIKWSRKQDGYFKQWINGKLVYHYLGNTSKPKGSVNHFTFGIYRGATKKTPEDSTQIVYYDEVRFVKKSCKKLKLEDLGYSCEDLESQQIDNIDKIIIGTEKIVSLSGKYKMTWYWTNKNLTSDAVLKREKIVSDVINVDKGKVKFVKLGSSKVISDKYREKVKFLQSGKDEIVVEGELDLDTDSTDQVRIILKPGTNNGKNYYGIGLFSKNNKKNRSENIEVLMEPIK